jgi:hypothetical protein
VVLKVIHLRKETLKHSIDASLAAVVKLIDFMDEEWLAQRKLDLL